MAVEAPTAPKMSCIACWQKMNCVMLCCSCSPTNKICPMLCLSNKSQNALASTLFVVANGLFKLAALHQAMACLKVSIGSLALSKQKAKLANPFRCDFDLTLMIYDLGYRYDHWLWLFVSLCLLSCFSGWSDPALLCISYLRWDEGTLACAISLKASGQRTAQTLSFQARKRKAHQMRRQQKGSEEDKMRNWKKNRKEEEKKIGKRSER